MFPNCLAFFPKGCFYRSRKKNWYVLVFVGTDKHGLEVFTQKESRCNVFSPFGFCSNRDECVCVYVNRRASLPLCPRFCSVVSYETAQRLVSYETATSDS